MATYSAYDEDEESTEDYLKSMGKRIQKDIDERKAKQFLLNQEKAKNSKDDEYEDILNQMSKSGKPVYYQDGSVGFEGQEIKGNALPANPSQTSFSATTKEPLSPKKAPPGKNYRFDGEWVRNKDGSLSIIKKNERYENE